MNVWCVFYWAGDQPILSSIHATRETAERSAHPGDAIESWAVHDTLNDGSDA